MKRGRDDISRKQLKQVFSGLARSLNHGNSATAASLMDIVGSPPGPLDVPGILADFRRTVGNPCAKDVPALAVSHLPVPPSRVIVVLDGAGRRKRADDADVVITVTSAGAHIKWYDTSLMVGRGCR